MVEAPTVERRRGAPLTREQKQELWRRWKQGESAAGIARALDRFPDAVRAVLIKNGGIVPRERKRAASALTLAVRESISRGAGIGSDDQRASSRAGASGVDDQS